MDFNTEILKLWETQNVCLYSFAWKYVHIWSLDGFQFSAKLESLSHTLFLPHSLCAHVYTCVWAYVCVCVYLPISHCFSPTLSLHLSTREKVRERESLCVYVYLPLSHTLFLWLFVISVFISMPVCTSLNPVIYSGCYVAESGLELTIWPSYCETPDPSACASWETRTK